MLLGRTKSVKPTQSSTTELTPCAHGNITKKLQHGQMTAEVEIGQLTPSLPVGEYNFKFKSLEESCTIHVSVLEGKTKLKAYPITFSRKRNHQSNVLCKFATGSKSC